MFSTLRRFLCFGVQIFSVFALCFCLVSADNRSLKQAVSYVEQLSQLDSDSEATKPLADLAALQLFKAMQFKSPDIVLPLVSSLSDLSIANQLDYWIELSATMGEPNSLFYLSQAQQDTASQTQFLERAAIAGHTKSQFELALRTSDMSVRLNWLTQSANSQYMPAVIALAKLYYEMGDTKQAKFWLQKSSTQDGFSSFKLAKLEWDSGNTKHAISLFENAEALGYSNAVAYIEAIKASAPISLASWLSKSFTSLSSSNTDEVLSVHSEQCLQNIEIVATNLSSFVQARQFIALFRNDSRVNHLPICIKAITWLANDVLSCAANYKQSGRLSCDWLPVAQQRKIPDFSHLIVFAEQGKANVNNGIMYLDRADQYSVFIHELAHFSGFVDEYALTTDVANYHCTQNTAPNLLLIEDEDYLPPTRAAEWQLFLDQVNQFTTLEEYQSLGRSKTCNNIEKISFKPSNQMTFLEFHDVENIPDIYLMLWLSQLQKWQNQRPVFTNFAIQAWEHNKTDLAIYWESQSSN